MAKDVQIIDLINEIKIRKKKIEDTLLTGDQDRCGSDYYAGKLDALLEMLIWFAENKTKSE